MTATDFMPTKFCELPAHVLSEICLYLHWDVLRELINVPQLQEITFDLASNDTVTIVPACDLVEIQWNGEQATLKPILTGGTIFDLFKKYPPRTCSVCVQAGFVDGESLFLHNLLKRAGAIEIWSLEKNGSAPPKKVTGHDLRLLLSYPEIRSVDLNQNIMHHHHRDLRYLLPQITGLQSLKLEIEKGTQLPYLSSLRYLKSLELFTDEGDEVDTGIDIDFPVDSTHKLLYRVFSQDSFLPSFSPHNMNFPPMLKSLLFRRLGLTSVEVFLLPSTLETLDLSSNIIDTFEFAETDPLWPVNLKSIMLHDNKIETDTFQALLHIKWPPLLQSLDLLGNPFTSIEHLRHLPDSMSHLKLSGSLSTLKVSHNSDGYPFFKFPTSLQTLSFARYTRVLYERDDTRGHEGLHTRVRFPANLESLTFILGRKPNCLSNMIFPPSLKTLRLVDMAIKDLTSYNSLPGDPEEVNWSQLTNLRELDLGYNRITTLVNWFPPKLLCTLNLRCNDITRLQSELTPLFNEQFRDLTSNISLIDLLFNHIHSIDENVDLPQNLRELNLRGNFLSQFVFSESLACHQKLLKLDLRMNQIEKISVQNHKTRKMSPLQELYLRGNSTKKITTDTLMAVFRQLGLKPKNPLDEPRDEFGDFILERLAVGDTTLAATFSTMIPGRVSLAYFALIFVFLLLLYLQADEFLGGGDHFYYEKSLRLIALSILALIRNPAEFFSFDTLKILFMSSV